jgi:BolA protein
MTISDTIHRRLVEALSPIHLEVIDESHLHAGHSGTRPEGETHFRVVAVSSVFDGQSRIGRQRQVYALLNDLLEGPVHALSLALSSPEDS